MIAFESPKLTKTCQTQPSKGLGSRLSSTLLIIYLNISCFKWSINITTQFKIVDNKCRGIDGNFLCAIIWYINGEDWIWVIKNPCNMIRSYFMDSWILFNFKRWSDEMLMWWKEMMKRPKRATQKWNGAKKRMTIRNNGNHNIANMKVAKNFTNVS
jgi:hypothetical protein